MLKSILFCMLRCLGVCLASWSAKGRTADVCDQTHAASSTRSACPAREGPSLAHVQTLGRSGDARVLGEFSQTLALRVPPVE